MPRNGDGSSDNAIDAGKESLIHGAGSAPGDGKSASGVDRSSKAAPPPNHEHGEALEGMNASGGGATAKGSGEGPLEPAVEAEAKGK